MVKFDFTGQNLIIGIRRGEAPLVGRVDFHLSGTGQFISIRIYPLQGTGCRIQGTAIQRQSCIRQGLAPPW